MVSEEWGAGVIYRHLLKADFERLPRALRDFHATPGGGRATGRVAVRHASALARLLGMPPSGDDIPMQLEVIAEDHREVWIRRFGDVARRTVQYADGETLVETIGPLRMHFRLIADNDGVRFECIRARLFGIPFPLRVNAAERGGDSSWEFEVVVARIGSYRGVMSPVL